MGPRRASVRDACGVSREPAVVVRPCPSPGAPSTGTLPSLTSTTIRFMRRSSRPEWTSPNLSMWRNQQCESYFHRPTPHLTFTLPTHPSDPPLTPHPSHPAPSCRDLIRKLLTVDRTKRVGAMRVSVAVGAGNVYQGNLFLSCPIAAWRRRRQEPQVVQGDQLGPRATARTDGKPHPPHKSSLTNTPLPPSQPPILPRVAHPGDTNNFDKYPEDGWLNAPPLSDRELDPFVDF